MTLAELPEQNVVFATDQLQYMPLPAWRAPNDPEGRIVCCWKLTDAERQRVLETGEIWHHILTFNQPLQPQLLSVEKPEMS